MGIANLGTTKTTGGIGTLGKIKAVKKTADLSTFEGLQQKATEAGYGSEALKIADTTPKLSFLQRLGKGLGSFNPAEAILTGMEEESILGGVKKYGTGILKGIGSAITGKDIEGERRYFSDVVEKFGIENGIAKFGLGFIGDVLLDPTTYFGGVIAKGIGATTKGVGKLALKGIGKIAPETEAGLRLAGTGLKDALGRAFQYGYKSSKGATDDILSFLSKEQQAKLGLASSNLNRLGTGVLSKSQSEELALKMIAGKRAEFLARETENIIPKTQKFIPVRMDKGVKFNASTMGGTNIKLKFKTEAGAMDYVKNGKGQIAYFDQKGFTGAVGKDIGWVQKVGNNNRIVSTLEESIKKTPAEIAKETALKGTSPEVAKVIEEQMARSKKIGEQIGLENPYEVYFPFIKKDKLAKFLNESKGIKVGSEGYRKQFKNLLTNEAMELDPAKAFFTRESQIVTDKMTRDFLSGFVKKYGKGLDEFKSVDEALKNGFTLIKEKGSFGKDLGYINKFDGALIRDSISPEFQTINMLAKATGFDAITSLFKRSVTGLFAPFHIRNYMSGLIQNFEVLGADAFNPKNIAIGQKIAYLMGKGAKIPKGTLNIAGKTMQFDDVMKPFVNRFSGDTFYNTDFMMAVEKGVELKQVAKTFGKQRVIETAKTLGLGQEAIPFKIGRGIGQFIEHQQKATAYITALGQGKAIPQALKLAEAAGFDYRALTRFESQIMRRIVPFYSFTRKNIELQLKTLGENPQRINQVLRFFGSIGETISEEEKQALPDFIKESLGIKLQDTPEGLKQYISSFGTPIEAFAQVFGKNPILRAISMMNPILKVPIEIGIGKDSFRQRELKDVYTANEYNLAPKIIKDLLSIKEVQKDVLDKNKQGKLVKVGERTEYQADPIRLLIARSLFTSRGVSYLDQVFDNDLQGFVKVLKTTTGMKPQQIDIEMYKAIKDKEKRRALEDLLIRTGELREYRNVYEPKK